MTDVAQRPPGDPADDPQAEEKDEALDRIVQRGAPRLNRAWYDLLATATVAGLEIGFGVLALLLVEHETGSRLLGSLAFSIGFVALFLGHSELFTEGFLVPVTAVVAGAASWLQLLRLWIGTLVGNLAGGWVGIALVIVGGGLYHSILDSILVFAALDVGAPGIGYGDWLSWFTWTVVGNMLGGLGLVTLLRLVRSQERLAQWRRSGDEPQPSS